MRKFLLTGIGALLVSGALVFTSDAQTSSCNCFVSDSVDQKSRYTSKGCCADAKRATRPFSNRIGPWQYRKTRTKCKNCKIYKNPHASGRDDVYLYDQYKKSNLTRAQKLAYQRQIFGENNGGRILNTVASNRNVVRNNDFVYKAGKLDTRNNVVRTQPKNFTVSVPRSFVKTDGIYRTQNSSLAFRVTSGGTCNPIAFQDCAKRLDNQLQKESNFAQIYGEQTFHRWNQTVLTDFDYYQTITKSYNATNGGKHHSYFTFTALDPNTNEIVRIEGVANSRESNIAAQQAHKIFESFRFRT